MDEKQTNIKTAFEIGALAGELNIRNQMYVLNTINALLFSQQINEKETKLDLNKDNKELHI